MRSPSAYDTWGNETPYPEGFNKDNCVIMSFMAKSPSTGYWYLNGSYTIENLSGNQTIYIQQHNFTFTETGIKSMCMKYTTNRELKVVLMRTDI